MNDTLWNSYVAPAFFSRNLPTWNNPTLLQKSLESHFVIRYMQGFRELRKQTSLGIMRSSYKRSLSTLTPPKQIHWGKTMMKIWAVTMTLTDTSEPEQIQVAP